MKEDEGGWWTASELPVTRCDQPGLVPLPCFPLFLAVRFHGQWDGFFFTLLDGFFPSFIDPRTGAKRMRARFARRGTQRLTGEASED